MNTKTNEAQTAKTARAHAVAHSFGLLDSHFIVVDAEHFNALLESAAIIPTRFGLVKFTTGKPVWVYSYETGEESAEQFLDGLAGYIRAKGV